MATVPSMCPSCVLLFIVVVFLSTNIESIEATTGESELSFEGTPFIAISGIIIKMTCSYRQ